MRVGSASRVAVVLSMVAALAPLAVGGQSIAANTRITTEIDESRRTVLRGNVHPLAANAPTKALSSSVPMEHMILHLNSDPSQQAALDQLVAQQHDPKSPLYHQFLSAQEFGQRFGVSTADLNKITSWLASHGLNIDEIPTNHRSVVFSGTSDQVASAFKTEIRSFTSGGVTHYGNVTDPQIPAALSAVVGGVVKLHNVQHQAAMAKLTDFGPGLRQPEFTASSGHYLAPADYGTIYNLNPLYKNNLTGKGQSIAIIARSNISLQDVQSFRQSFALAANDPSFIFVNSDPGVLSGDSTETTLDTEWSGAVAPGASIKVVIASSTNTADGIDLAAQYAVNGNVAPVISLSYGSCEAYMGSAEMAFYNGLWQQAAAQGITVLVSSGDSGAAGCDSGYSTKGSMKAVNGLCSSPYSTCVGGTQFNEGANPGQYWLAGNNPGYGSAISYIPETAWNESGSTSGGSGLWAGGGGASTYYAKPSWQSVTGVPADGHRDVPDVSLAAAGHDGYVVVQSGRMIAVSGTSAAAPSFAGMMAIVDQNANARQGNANTRLYPLFASQTTGTAPIFHDTTAGNNSVPSVTGFTAVAGYDLATGLGSVDANQLVTRWANAATSATPSLNLSASSTSFTVAAGQSSQATITSTATALKSAVALSVSGAPSGITAVLGASTIAAPGSGAVALTVAVSKTVVPGTYPIVVSGKSGTLTSTVTVTVTVPKPTFTLAADPSAFNLVAGQSGVKVTLTATAQYGFSSALSLKLSGLPQGVAAAMTQTILNLPGAPSSPLTLTAGPTAIAGTYSLVVTATGSGVTQTIPLSITISSPVSCTFAASPSKLGLTAGQASTLQLACTAVKGTFTGPLNLALVGIPSGVRAALGSSTLVAGSSTTLSLSSDLTAAAGTYSLNLTAAATGFTQTISVPLTITVPSIFTFTAAQSALSIKGGAAGTLTFVARHLGTFSSVIRSSVAGLPQGVTANFSPASFAAPGDGTTTLSFSVSAATVPGSYPVIVTATATSGQSVPVPVTLTVAAAAGFSMNVSTNSMSVAQGGQPSIVTISTGNFTGGFNSTISLSFSNLAPGMNYGFSSATADQNFVHTSIGIWASASTPVGVYPIKLTVSGGGIVYTQTISVTVTAPTAAKH